MRNLLIWLYVLVICFVALCRAGLYFYWLSRTVRYPYEIDYGEGIVLWQVQHVTRLASAYAPITRYPYIVFHYPPFYHFVCWMVSRFTGDLLFAGRMVSMVSALGLCLTSAWLVYHSVPVHAGKTAAVGGAVLAGALPCGIDAMGWARLMRVDTLGVWLTFAGLALFILSRTTAQRYGAFIFFVAALYTRQTLIAAPAACLLVSAILNSRQMAKLLAFGIALGGSVLMFLALVTQGQVIRHLFLYTLGSFSIARAMQWEAWMGLLTLPLLCLGAAVSFNSMMELGKALVRHNLARVRAHLSRSPYRRALVTISIYFVLAAAASIAIGKEGSNVNYFLEWHLSACLLAGLFFARLVWNWNRRTTAPKLTLSYVLILVIVAQPTLALVRAIRLVVYPSIFRQQMSIAAHHSEILVQILRATPEPVMSEDMTLLYRADKQVPFEPFIVTHLAEKGAWNESPLVSLIDRKGFSLMIINDLNNPVLYSPGVASAIRTNYEPTERYGDLTVYRPIP